MMCGQIYTWGTTTMQDNLSLSPDILTASAAGSSMLRPSYTLRCISPRMNPTISGVHADAWGSFLIAFSGSSINQDGPVLTGILSSM